ncbi:MAG: hypothetical protein COT74_09265 [Bdellovibrionales bacterium CG10_big_fil_rev_8_21_14_0_10_45_34]|nr:MAG: hypothetical protein COT74_09265 [Bdellovibrionales bacterium CG10_big_fil_rev_8_21_14_0_10_45_34]
MKIVSLGSWTAASQLDSALGNAKENQQVTPILGADQSDPILNEQSVQSRLSFYERGLWAVFEEFKQRSGKRPKVVVDSHSEMESSDADASPTFSWMSVSGMQRGMRSYLSAVRKTAKGSDSNSSGQYAKVWLDIYV